jgi:hypothetical protein
VQFTIRSMSPSSRGLALYKNLAEDPDRWYDSALVLKGVAEAIGEIRMRAARAFVSGNHGEIEQLTYGPPFPMLAGLAIENLAKAIVLRRTVRKSEGGKLPQGIAGHGKVLDHLADAGITLSDAERALARRLAKFVVWAGRYPVPMKAPPGASDLEVGAQTSYSDLDQFRRFFAKLERRYRGGGDASDE